MNYLARKASRLFCDSLKIKVRGGTGGPGLPSHGGIGGKGGDVYITCSSNVRRLDAIVNSPHCKAGWFKAGDGKASIRTRLLGEAGRDLYLKVPVGVTVLDSDGQHVGDLNKPNDKIILALGGRGGDKFNDNQGFTGQQRKLKLDLKMISDAVLVGFPNAGKSTLLRALSAAKPKVDSYPFTTLRPHLGVIEYKSYRRITIADLPGLVEGAHKNLGLGHEFLKHIVRSRLLVFLIDINDCDLGPSYPQRSPFETLCILNREIELYDDTILSKPAILVLSKFDEPNNEEYTAKQAKFLQDMNRLYTDGDSTHVPREFRPSRLLRFSATLTVSAMKSHGIKDLKTSIHDVIDQSEEAAKLARDGFSSYAEMQASENNRIIQ